MTDDELDRLLGSLPRVSPSSDFADRVMARVTVPEPSIVKQPVPAPRRPRFALVASLAVVMIGMVASALWTLANETTLASFGQWLSTAAGEWTMQGVRDVMPSIARWSPTGLWRAGGISPSSLAIGSGLGSLLYVGGAFLLYRLMIVPTSRAEYAQR